MNYFASKYWDKRVDEYQEIYFGSPHSFKGRANRLFRRAFFERIDVTFTWLDDLEGKRVLDVGCGNGAYMLEALRAGAAHVTGIDISSAMLSAADYNLTKGTGRKNGWSLIQTTLEGFIEAREYEVVLAMGIVEYMNNPLKVLRLLKKMVSEVLICSFSCLVSSYSLARLISLSLAGKKVTLLSYSQLSRLIRMAGFDILCYKRIGPSHWVVLSPKKEGVYFNQ